MGVKAKKRQESKRYQKLGKGYPQTITQKLDRDNTGIFAVAVQNALER